MNRCVVRHSFSLPRRAAAGPDTIGESARVAGGPIAASRPGPPSGRTDHRGRGRVRGRWQVFGLVGAARCSVPRSPTGRRFPGACTPSALGGFRSHIPLRGSPGFAPGFPLATRVAFAPRVPTATASIGMFFMRHWAAPPPVPYDAGNVLITASLTVCRPVDQSRVPVWFVYCTIAPGRVSRTGARRRRAPPGSGRAYRPRFRGWAVDQTRIDICPTELDMRFPST